MFSLSRSQQEEQICLETFYSTSKIESSTQRVLGGAWLEESGSGCQEVRTSFSELPFPRTWLCQCLQLAKLQRRSTTRHILRKLPD